MNSNLLKNISIPALIFFYFSFCGGLYLMTYWSFFGVDAFDLIQLQDIIKSAFKPLYTNKEFLLLFLLATFGISFVFSVGSSKLPKIDYMNSKNVGYIQLAFLAFFIFIFYVKPTMSYLYLAGILLYFKTLVDITHLKILPDLDLDFKRNFVYTLVIIPSILVTTAKEGAMDILLNKKFTSVISINIKDSSLNLYSNIINTQFLGYIGDLAIFRSPLNEKIYFISRADIVSMELLENKFKLYNDLIDVEKAKDSLNKSLLNDSLLSPTGNTN